MSLSSNLTHKNPFVRKAASFALQLPRAVARASSSETDFQNRPPVLANSFPKSGTHLLNQLVDGLHGLQHYGAFLSSMTSSFQFRERSVSEMTGCLKRIVPGEIVRGHVYFDPSYQAELRNKRVAHFFIYRDPRDVVVSSAKYLRAMNPWHKLHKHYKECNEEESILQSIRGVDAVAEFPDVAKRFENYQGWLHCEDAFAVRYEDLVGEQREQKVAEMAAFYRGLNPSAASIEEMTSSMLNAVDPSRSHTMRKGGAGGWRAAFTDQCKDAFKEVAGDLLIELGYETSKDW